MQNKVKYKEIAMFALGGGGFMHELLFVAVERPFIIAASLGLMGLPFVIRGENSLKDKDQ